MAKRKYTYKVWIQVEKQHIESGDGEDVDLDFSSEAEFSTEDKAVAYASKLHDISQAIIDAGKSIS